MASNIAMLTIATKIDNASINKSVNQLSTKVRDGLESAFAGIDKETQKGFEKTIESIGEGRLKNVNLSGQFKELTSSILSSKNADELKESFKKFSSIIGMIDDLAAGRGKIGGMMPTLRSLDNSQMSRLVESLSAEKHAKDLRDKKTLNGKKAEDLYSEAEAKSIDNLLKKYPKAEKEAEKFKKQILDSDENGAYKKASSSIEEYSKLVGLLKEMEKHSPKKDDKNIISYGKEMENVFSSMSKYEADSKKYGSEKSIGDFLKTVRKDSGVLKGQDAYFQYRGVASAEDYINAINSRNLKKKTQEKENLIRKLQEEINKRGERVSASYENWKEESGETGKAGDANPPDAKNFKTAIITVEQYDEALKNLKNTLEGFYAAYENGDDIDLAEFKGAMDLYKDTEVEDSSWFKKYKEAFADLAYNQKITPARKTIGDYLPTDGINASDYNKALADVENMKSELGVYKSEVESLKSQVESLNSELQKANDLVDELSNNNPEGEIVNTENSAEQLEKEATEADNVKQSMDEAAQAKNKFAEANKKVEASAEKSAESLHSESAEAEKAEESVQENSSKSYGDFLKDQIKVNPEAEKARKEAQQQEISRLEEEKKKVEEEAKKQVLKQRKTAIADDLDEELKSYQSLSGRYYPLKEKSALQKTDSRDEYELAIIESNRTESLEKINQLLLEGKKIKADTLQQEEKLQAIEDANGQSERDLNNVFSKEALKKYNSKANRMDISKPGYKYIKDELETHKSFASSASSLDDVRNLGDDLDKLYDKYKRFNSLSKGNIFDQAVDKNNLLDSIKSVVGSDGSKILKIQELTSSENGIIKYVAEIKNANHELQKMYFTYDDVIGKMSSTKASKGFERTGILGFIDQIKDKSSYLSAQFISQFFDFGDIVGYVREGVEKVKELDSAFIEMQKVSNDSTSSLKSFADQSFDTSKNIGTTAVDLQSSAADWMRIGESIDEASKSAEATSILKNVSEFTNIEDATSSLISMSQAYSNLDKMDIVDKMNELGNNYAISTDELSKGLQDSASTLSLLGNSIDESAAIITAGNTIIQNVSSVAAGARTIALRLVGKLIMPKHMVTYGAPLYA